MVNILSIQVILTETYYIALFLPNSITDEFVSLDAKTDVMAKLDAVVKGDMDETYQYREENVNANKKKGRGDMEKEEDDDGGKKGKKRASAASAPKKRKR